MNRFFSLIKSRMSRGRADLLLVALLFSAALAPRACLAAPPTLILPNVVGLWSGEFASATGATGFSSLEITTQHTRRFVGTFTFFPNPNTPPSPCFVRGTASDSGRISLVGASDSFKLHADGQLTGDQMSLNYLLVFADGSFDNGTATIAGLTIGGGP